MEKTRPGEQAMLAQAADVIDAQSERIVERWLQRLNQTIYAQQPGLSREELLDVAPLILRGVSEALRHNQPEALHAPWTAAARAHAFSRRSQGEELTELLREFQVLRQEIWAVLAEQLPAMPGDDVFRLARGLGAALDTMGTILSRTYGAELQRYRLLSENARDIILFIGEDARIIEANRAAEQTYGYSHSELAGMSVYQLRAVETGPKVADEMARAQAVGITFETVHRRRDGSIFPVEVSSRGAIVAGRRTLLSIVRDITKRKQAQEELARRESEFRSILASLPDIVSRVDRNLRYTFVSPSVQRFGNVPPSGYIGKTRRETGLFDEATLQSWEAHSKRAFETGQAQTFEYTLTTPQGIYYYLVRIIPERDAEGHVVSLLNVSLDVTERKRAETERERLLADLRMANERLVMVSAREQQLALEAERRAEEAEAALRLRDEFLEVAAHELKTPLTSLRGQAELTMRRIEQGRLQDPQQMRGALQVIDRQVDRLDNLVMELLVAARLEAGELPLERQQVDLVPMLHELVEDMQATTARHTLSLQAPPSLTAYVDPMRVREVLYSLIHNAIRYSPEGGPVQIDLSTPDADTVRIAVRDHGIGVAPKDRPLLFDRFWQASRRPVGGLGLGLYVSRRIVEHHGGHIWAEFPEDGGSRFIITLPRDRERSEEGER